MTQKGVRSGITQKSVQGTITESGYSVVGTAPVFVSAAVANATPTKVVLTYDQDIDGASVPATTDFTVTDHTISSVVVSGATVELTLSTPVIYFDILYVTYSKGTNPLRGSIGQLDADNLTSTLIINNVLNAGWTTLTSDILFYGALENISGGRLYNEMDGATDYIEVTGSAGSYVFQCPNNATYIAADTDYIWFKTDGTRRSTTEAELIGYDFPRTPVKYDNESPNSIRIIMILKAGITLSASYLNYLFYDFQLHPLWNDSWNDNGAFKDNRGFENLTWTPETIVDPFAQALIDRMAAAGEAQTEARQANIDNTIKAFRSVGLFETRFAGVYFPRAKGTLSRKMNWIQNAYNLTKLGAGTLTEIDDVGITADGNCGLKTGYKPSIITGLYEQDNASFGIKIGGTINASSCHGAFRVPRTVLLQTYNRMNCADSGGTAKELGYNCLARNASDHFKQYKNAATADITAASTGKSIDEITFLCGNSDGSVYSGSTTEIMEFGFFGAYISQAEFLIIQNIVNQYIAAL